MIHTIYTITVGSCVYLCLYMYVISWKLPALVNAVQAQRDSISNLMVLDFLDFVHYFMS